MSTVDILTQDRALIARVISDLTEDQLLIVPDGHNNNMLWNVGHVVVVQQLLHYKLSGLPTYVSEETIALYSRGTSPADWKDTPDIDAVRAHLISLPDRLREDFYSGKFVSFQAYETSTGVKIASFEDALSFNHFHEGVHTGIMLSMKKRLG